MVRCAVPSPLNRQVGRQDHQKRPQCPLNAYFGVIAIIPLGLSLVSGELHSLDTYVDTTIKQRPFSRLLLTHTELFNRTVDKPLFFGVWSNSGPSPLTLRALSTSAWPWTLETWSHDARTLKWKKELGPYLWGMIRKLRFYTRASDLRHASVVGRVACWVIWFSGQISKEARYNKHLGLGNASSLFPALIVNWQLWGSFCLWLSSLMNFHL